MRAQNDSAGVNRHSERVRGELNSLRGVDRPPHDAAVEHVEHDAAAKLALLASDAP